jgi:NTP pyrophosphatase (non-canonical NTP hydrolase)
MNQGTVDRIRKFTQDREWDQFHSPTNLAKSIVIEAAELLEFFQWPDENFDLQHVIEELADVMIYCQNLLDKLALDADEILNMKMAQNEAKYPVEKAKGKSAKYDELLPAGTNLPGAQHISVPPLFQPAGCFYFFFHLSSSQGFAATISSRCQKSNTIFRRVPSASRTDTIVFSCSFPNRTSRTGISCPTRQLPIT